METTNGGTDSGSGTVTSDSDSVTATAATDSATSATAGSMSGSGTGATDSSVSDSTTNGSATTATTSESGTETGEGDCANGMKDGDETDVDCGGSCGSTCKDGEICEIDDDCFYKSCHEDKVCGDPACSLQPENNSCQQCLKQECCDQVAACLADSFCACWYQCIQHTNDFEPCKNMCGTGNAGPITSCANSRCNSEGACA